MKWGIIMAVAGAETLLKHIGTRLPSNVTTLLDAVPMCHYNDTTLSGDLPFTFGSRNE